MAEQVSMNTPSNGSSEEDLWWENDEAFEKAIGNVNELYLEEDQTETNPTLYAAYQEENKFSNLYPAYQLENDFSNQIPNTIQEDEDNWWKNDGNIDNILINFQENMNSPPSIPLSMQQPEAEPEFGFMIPNQSSSKITPEMTEVYNPSQGEPVSYAPDHSTPHADYLPQSMLTNNRKRIAEQGPGGDDVNKKGPLGNRASEQINILKEHSSYPPEFTFDSQMPAQTMIPAAGEVSLHLRRVPTQIPGPSRWMLASNEENKRGVIHKPCDLIEALSQFLPYPPKEDAASTLSDVVDYIAQTQGEIQQLDEHLSSLLQQYSQLTAGVQPEDTAAQDYNIAGSPVSGLIEMPNQMEGTDHHLIPAMGIPVNQSAEAAAGAGKQAADDAAALNQAADQAADVDASDGSGVVHSKSIGSQKT